MTWSPSDCGGNPAPPAPPRAGQDESFQYVFNGAAYGA